MTVYTSNIEVTTSDVYTMSGTNPDITTIQNSIQQAQFFIETVVGVPFIAADRDIPISTTDAAWIKKAVVFQVIWLMGQVAPLERQSVSQLSQDGVSVTAPDELTFVLAPMAKRALNNCSWAKTGTLKVAPAEVPDADTSFLTSDNHAWAPLGGV
jgi:hypothetical protein